MIDVIIFPGDSERLAFFPVLKKIKIQKTPSRSEWLKRKNLVRSRADGLHLGLSCWRPGWLCWSPGPASTEAPDWTRSWRGRWPSPRCLGAPEEAEEAERRRLLIRFTAWWLIRSSTSCQMWAETKLVLVFCVFFSRKSLQELKRGLKTRPFTLLPYVALLSTTRASLNIKQIKIGLFKC